MKSSIGFVVVATLCIPAVFAFVSRTSVVQPKSKPCFLSAQDENEGNSISRRQCWVQTSQILGTMLLGANPAIAKSSTEEADKQKIVKGYERLNYLVGPAHVDFPTISECLLKWV